MPVITLDIVPFLSEDQKAQLVKEFTDSASKVTGINPKDFYVSIKETPKDSVAIGGELMSKMNK